MSELEPITRPNGKVYRPRKVVTWKWENEGYPNDDCGVVVLGTQDLDRALKAADRAIKFWYDTDLVPANPEVNWFRLGYSYGDLVWLRDETSGRAGVMFTADYPAAPQHPGDDQ